MTVSAYAQDEAPPPEAAAEEQDTIIVTGSRIPRPDLVANSPVTVVDSEEVTLTGTVNAEELLNELPQVIPGLDRSANNPGNGTATVSLRGLGTNRTLVLVNGRRWVPSGLGSTVDINTIPAALIERVDVVTGGASAVYGSDAVAGVVNFILNDNFEGVEVSSQYRFTDQGDGGIWDIHAAMGGNFDNGRGNATIFFSHTDRDPLLQGDRDFSFFALQDNVGAGTLVPGGSSLIPGTSVFANLATDPITGFGGVAGFDTNGNLVPFAPFNYAPFNYLQLPQERWNLFGASHYEVTNWMTAYMEGTYTSSRVPQQLAPTPFFSPGPIFSSQMTMYDTSATCLGFATEPAAGCNNPFLSESAADTLYTSQDGTFTLDGVTFDTTGDGVIQNFIGRRLLENTERFSDNSFETLLLTTGVRGDLGLGDWRYDVYYQYGQVVAPTVLRGDASAARIEEGLLIEYVGGAGGDPNDPSQWACVSGNPRCVPLNIYGEGNLTPAMVSFLNLTVASVQRVEQTVINGAVNGSLFTIPTADNPFQVAFGLEYRENVGDFTADTPLAIGDVAGFNDAPSVRGRFDVWEAFFEGRLPLIEGRHLIHNLTLEGGWRYSDYSTAGGTTTFRGGGEYAPIADIRFRGLYQKAVRAPNISELFSPQGNNFPGAADPCSGGVNGGYDGSQDAACLASGVPAAAIGTNIQANSQIQATVGGNPALEPEIAKTWTVGAVIQPRYVPGLTVTVDYYNIDIDGVIAPFGGNLQNVLDNCIDKFNGDPGNLFCSVIQRAANGRIQNVNMTLLNASGLHTSGIDLQVDYGIELADMFGASAPGRIDYNFVGTWTETSDFLPDPASDLVECSGEFADVCGEPTPAYKFTQRLSYRVGDVTLSLRHRWLSSVVDGTVNSASGCVNFVVCEIDSTHYLDFSALWDVTEHVRLGGGVRNLMDTDPPILGNNQEQANTWPATYSPYGVEIFFSGRLKY